MNLERFISRVVEPGAVTLFVGPPASGKTHFLLQVVKLFTGNGDGAFLVDTEGISLKRVSALGLERLRVTFAESLEEVEAAVKALPGDAKLLCIDSLVMPYRLILPETPQEANLRLSRLLKELTAVAVKRGIPVVATGHVYRTEEGKLKIVGGDVILYWAKAIVLLTKDSNGRKAKVVKHRSIKEGLVLKFDIAEGGIYGL